MGEFYVYSIKVAVCLTVFYLLYKSLLSRETFHRFNRATLLGMIALSLTLPAAHIHTTGNASISKPMTNLSAMITKDVAVNDAQSTDLTLTQTLFLIYIIGVGVFLIRELQSLTSLLRLIRSGRHETAVEGFRLTIINRDISPFSWFNNVVISEKDFKERPHEILTHEYEHVRRLHSADILLCDALRIFQWFNPTAWLIKAEMQNVHEYEADEAVLRSGVCASDYQLLLIRKAVGERLYSMANNLNQYSIKKRIIMMMTKKSNKWSRAKLLVVLPVAAFAIAAFANEKVESVSNEIKKESNSLVKEMQDNVEKVAYTVRLPYKGQEQNTADEHQKKITVKTNSKDSLAMKGRKDDKVTEAYAFKDPIITVDGKETNKEELSKLPSNDIESINVLKGDAAVKSYGDKGKNGVVEIRTKSNGSDKAEEQTYKQPNMETKRMTKCEMVEAENKYIVVNGEHTDATALKEVKPSDIKSIRVLNGAEAAAKYGKEAASGAIEVTKK